MNDTKTQEPETAEFTEEVREDGGREVSTQTGQRSTAMVSVTGASMMEMIERLALDERVDAGKLETIARVARETRLDEKKEQYYQDKVAAMFEMPVIRKDKRIIIPGKNGAPDRVQGTFASWPDLQRAIDPVLYAYRLRLSHEIGHEGTVVLVRPVLQHANGFVEKGDQMALPLDTSGGKNNTQGSGSASTYGQRYTTVPFLGIRYEAAHDDDGALGALPDEPMNDQQQRRVEEAEIAASRGAEAYENWFKTIPAIDRAWMIQTGRHADLGGAGQLPGARPREKAPQGVQAAQGGQAAAGKAEAWTVGYETDCEAVESLDALTALQDAAKGARAKLRGLHPELEQRCVDAGSAAFARLSEAQADGGDD